MPTAFRITLKDAPGALAHVASALAERGINLEASGGEAVGGKGQVTLLTSDVEATRDVLKGHNVAFEEVEILVVTLQDNPGALASVVHRLGEAGVNVGALVQLNRMHGRSDLGLVVDDPEKARSVLDVD